MKLIDINSRPPLPAFGSKGSHLSNYRRVYEASESKVHESLSEYLEMYESLQCEHVIIKAKDVETTFGVKISNEEVAQFCREHGPRFIGWAGVDPNKGKIAVEELHYAVRELGLRGLNLQCFEHKTAINDPKMYQLYHACVELDIPVGIHCGVNFSTDCLISSGRPYLLDEVMVNVPGLRVLAAPPGWPWVHELIAVAWRHSNLYIGLSAVRPKYLTKVGSGYEGLVAYGSSVLQNQIVFGSAYPMQPLGRAVDEMKTLPLTEEVLRKWMYENSARLLRVSGTGKTACTAATVGAG